MTTTGQLQDACEEVVRLSDCGLKEQALERCDELVQRFPDRPEPLRTRATIYTEYADYDSALADLQKLASLETGEPADYYDLGRILFRLKSFDSAIAALSECVELGKRSGMIYYQDAAILLRAESRLRCGDSQNARKDCQLLPEDYSAFVPGVGLRSVSEILELTSAG